MRRDGEARKEIGKENRVTRRRKGEGKEMGGEEEGKGRGGEEGKRRRGRAMK